MAKRVHNEPTSSKIPLIIMAIGAVLVAALVVWALTRTVEPAATPDATTAASAPPPATMPTGTSSPLSDPTATMTPPQQMPQATSTLSELPPVPPPGTLNAEASVPRMSAEDLRAKAGRGEVTVIDVRDAASYSAGHIPGAMHIPFSRVEAELSYIPKNKPIVTYCT